MQITIQTVQALLFTGLINVTHLSLAQSQLLLTPFKLCTTLFMLLSQQLTLCFKLAQLNIGLLQAVQAIALDELLSLIQQAP